MSELLQNWLNNEVGLSTNVAHFEKDFSNGYLFGEVLHKFRQQDDFDEFVNKNTYEAKLANFKRLEPTLKALGIKVNATQSNAMMNGERGMALRLLYQLKMATERLLLAADGGHAKPGGGSRAPAGGGVTKGIRVPRDKFDDHNKGFFEHRLRATCPNAKQQRIAKVTHKFNEELGKQEEHAYHLDSMDGLDKQEAREYHRFSQQEKLRLNKAAKDEWERVGNEKWQQNMQKRATREVFDVHFAKRVQQKQQVKHSRAREVHSEDVRDGVEKFETGLATLGFAKPREKRAGAFGESDSDSSDNSDNHIDRLLATTTPAANARELVTSLQSRMPNSEALEQEAGLFLQKIKESKTAGSIARKERERRRRRVLVEQQREQDLLEESKLEEVLLQKLGRESVEEKAISYDIWKTQKYEDVIVKNRQMRTQDYTARRKEDQQEALRRDQDLREEMLEVMREQEERERVRYRAIERGRRAEQRAKLTEECEGILELITGMAFAAMQQEQLTDSSEVDPTLWREWTQLFVENEPVPPAQSLEESLSTMYPLTASPENIQGAGATGPAIGAASQAAQGDGQSEQRVPVETLDEAALQDYVNSDGQWKQQELKGCAKDAEIERMADPVQQAAIALNDADKLSFKSRLTDEIDVVDGRPVNYRLGAIVAALLDRKYKQEPRPQPPPMPDVPLKLVISGLPFAGKKVIAGRLAEAYNLQIVNPEDILHECLMLSQRPDASVEPIHVMSFTAETRDDHCLTHHEQGNPYVKQLQDIGYLLQDLLDRGQAVSNELYVHMIVTKIRSLFPEEMARLLSQDSPGDADAAKDDDGALDATQFDSLDQEPDGADKTKLAAGDVGDNALATTSVDSSDIIASGGWILIGFADDAQRLQLLEQFVSGWIEPNATPTPAAEVQKARAALLAPAPPQDPPPFVLTPGGIDLYFRLEVAGDEVVRRAVGRRFDPGTSLTHHLEDHPPASKHHVIYERLEPVDDLNNSIGSLTHRVHSFDIAQPDVDFMLSYFGPFEDVKRLVRIDAGQTQDQVFDALDENVAILLERKRALKALELEAAEDSAEADGPKEEEAAADDDGGAAPDADGADGAAADAKSADEQSKSRKGSVSDEKAANPEPPAAEPPVPVELAELPKFIEDLEDQAFVLLLTEWEKMQEDVESSSRTLFQWHRTHLADFRSGLHGIQVRFVEYLQRPDIKQDLVDAYVQKFNVFSEEYPDMRKQTQTKDEWHQRVDDLHDSLTENISNHRTDSLEQVRILEESGWVPSQVDVVAFQIQHAVQLEVRRYHLACQLMSDFYYSQMGAGLPVAKEKLPRVNVLSKEPEPQEDEVAAAKAKAKAKPKAKPKDQEEPKADEGADKSKKRRYHAATLDADSNEVEGFWEFPFLLELVGQAQKAVWPLEEFSPPAQARSDSTDPDPKGGAKAKAKGRASPTPQVEKTEEVPVDRLYVDLQQGLMAERVSFMHRLATLSNWANRRLEALSRNADEMFEQCKNWTLLRRDMELQAAEGLVGNLKRVIESEPPELVTSRLTLEGSHLHIHKNIRLQPPVPPPKPPAIEAVSPFRWTIWQLDSMLEMIRGIVKAYGTSDCLVAASSLVILFTRLSQDFGDDAGVKEQLRVPSTWRGSDAERFEQLFGLFAHGPCEGMVDSVELLLHLGSMHSPLDWPSLKELLEVRQALEAAMPAGASWPDFWITTGELAKLPLFADPNSKEEKFAEAHAAKSAERASPFNRSRQQLLWVGRILQAFPAKLQKQQSWEVELSWYNYLTRCADDALRNADLVDDVKSVSSNSPRQSDGLTPLLTPAQPDTPMFRGSSEAENDKEGPPPLPPRPSTPTGLPQRPEGGIYVRQLLACFCLGTTVEEGISRACAVLGPTAREDAPLPMAALHSIALQFGSRPTPASIKGDGQPSFPPLAQFCEQLMVKQSGKMTAATFLANSAAQEMLVRYCLGRRHSRAAIHKLYPKDGKRYSAGAEPT